MSVMFRVACVVLLITGCRWHFDEHSGDGPPVDVPRAIDAAEGGACSLDHDCAPCQRCDLNRCMNEPIVSLYAGHRTTCFRGKAGSRWCVGDVTGLGSSPSTKFPTRIAGEDGWTELSLGWMNNLGLRNSAVYQWTSAASPTLFNADGTWAQITVEISSMCFLKASGALTCDGAMIPGNWINIDAGDSAFCGVQSDHSLWCWGTELGNQLGHGVVPDGTIVANPQRVGIDTDWALVSIGHGLTCAQKLDKSIWCWGALGATGTADTDTMGIPTRLAITGEFDLAGVRWQHACARNATGNVRCWGTDSMGLHVAPGLTTAGLPTLLTDPWEAFVMGGHHYCGRNSTGWYCWGWNAAGQLGNGQTITRVRPIVPICSTPPP